MNFLNLLFDFSSCLDKQQGGVHRRACGLFKLFSDMQHIKSDGLLYAAQGNLFSHYHHTQQRAEIIEQSNYFFHEALGHERFNLTVLLSQLKLDRLFRKRKKCYDLYPIDKLYHEVIWRNIFSNSLGPHSQEQILVNDFYFTDMTAQVIAQVNTSAYDIVVFPSVSAVRVASQSKKIVLCQDLDLMINPDIYPKSLLQDHVGALRQSVQDAFFVCHSVAAYKQLIHLFPTVENKSCVISDNHSFAYKRTLDNKILEEIILTRQIHSVDRVVHGPADYFLTASALDGASNLMNLVHAWEKLNYQYGRNLKWIVMTSSKSMSDQLRQVLRPHIDQANLILLTGLSEIEQSYLYSHAQCYVATNYTEANARDLLAALHYGCPVVVSDHAAHREILNDAALYCDPYSENSIADAMARLLYHAEDSDLANTLVENGVKQLRVFSPEKVSAHWIKLLGSIQCKQPNESADLSVSYGK